MHMAFRFAPPTADGTDTDCSDAEFFVLLSGYRDSGGLAHAPEVQAMLARQSVLASLDLEHGIRHKSVISYEWRHSTWIPLFQFNTRYTHPPHDLFVVLEALAPVYSALGLSQWFIQPHRLLSERAPLDCLDHGFAKVIDAARADWQQAIVCD